MRKLFTVIIVAIGICAIFIVLLRVWHESTLKDQELSRQNIIKVIASLKPGQTKPEVYAIHKERNWTAYSAENNEIRLWTKPQPLPANWIVRLVFENEKLVAIRFGSADNIDIRPENAPPDILWENTGEGNKGDK